MSYKNRKPFILTPFSFVLVMLFVGIIYYIVAAFNNGGGVVLVVPMMLVALLFVIVFFFIERYLARTQNRTVLILVEFIILFAIGGFIAFKYFI